MQMHRDTVLANVYTPTKYHQDRMKSDREIANAFFFSIFGLHLLPGNPIYNLTNFSASEVLDK